MNHPTRYHLRLLVTACIATVTAAADDGAKLNVGKETTANAEAETLQPVAKENVIVYKEPGRYGGWPANHGLWQWGDEIVVGFTATWYRETTTDHRIDRTKPTAKCRPGASTGAGPGTPRRICRFRIGRQRPNRNRSPSRSTSRRRISR